METYLLIKIAIVFLISLPISHFLLDRIINIGYLMEEKTLDNLKKIFYIPTLNVIIYFFYLIHIILKFKRPE